jgi:hypothetical protein
MKGASSMRYIPSLRRGNTPGMQPPPRGDALQSESALLERLLVRRFGPLPEALALRLKLAESMQLETWAQRMLQAECLEQVFADA